jgi:ribonucleoside-diphosphate reductase alpha chain
MVQERDWLPTDLQYDIWNKKYRYNNESLNEFFDRVSCGNEELKQLMIDKKLLQFLLKVGC